MTYNDIRINIQKGVYNNALEFPRGDDPMYLDKKNKYYKSEQQVTILFCNDCLEAIRSQLFKYGLSDHTPCLVYEEAYSKGQGNLNEVVNNCEQYSHLIKRILESTAASKKRKE